MRNLSVFVVAGLGLLIVGCKPGTAPVTGFGGFTQNQTQNGGFNTPNGTGGGFGSTGGGGMNMQQNNGGGLAGTWRCDLSSLQINLHMQQQPDMQQLQQMSDSIKQMLSSITLTLNADGSYTCTGGAQQGAGHYQLNGSSLQFQENNPSGQPLPQVSVAPDGQHLSMHIENQGVSVDINLTR